MDLQIFQFINDFAGRWGWLDWLGRFFATDLAYLIVIALVLVWFFRKEDRRMVVIAFVSGGIARGILVTLIRLLYHRIRPVPVEALHRLVVNTEWSFPSGHASFFFALAMGIFLYNKKLGAWLFVCAALMGFARIFVGVHWPSDIVAGAVLGILVAWGVNYFALKIERPRQTTEV